LDETRDSIQRLIQNAMNEFFEQHETTDDLDFASPRFSGLDDRLSRNMHGAFPQLIFVVIVTLSASGMGLGVYKLLNVWVKAKNGRKIHVKLPSGIVVDATQLTHQEFSALLAEVYAVYEKFEDRNKLIKYVKSKKLTQVGEDDLHRISQELSDAVQDKGEELRKREKRRK
jgi:hypothetical protein